MVTGFVKNNGFNILSLDHCLDNSLASAGSLAFMLIFTATVICFWDIDFNVSHVEGAVWHFTDL